MNEVKRIACNVFFWLGFLLLTVLLLAGERLIWKLCEEHNIV